jgi:E3 ubiquitin-protein ligase DRIP
VVETPRLEVKAGLTGKITKATRRRTAPHTTSADKNGTMKSSTNPESQVQSLEKHTTLQSTKVATAANKKQVNMKNHLILMYL